MFDYFFTYRSELPEGLGWEHFGPVHLTYLISFTVATIVLAVVYRRADQAIRQRIQVGYALIILTMEAVKQVICLITGVYEPGLVPLHLCGMSIFIISIHAFHPNRWTAELLYALVLPGAIAAELFSDWSLYPIANFFCQQSFFIHFFELSFPVLLIAGGDIRPSAKALWRPAVYLLAVVPPVYLFNKAFDTNFFFINAAAANSPLAFLEAWLGNPGYLLGFAGLLLVCWAVMYAPWAVIDGFSKKQKQA